MDLEFSEALEEILRNRGIRICKESILEKIEKKAENGKDGLSCHFVYQGETQEEKVDAVLVSVGRSADTEHLFCLLYTSTADNR